MSEFYDIQVLDGRTEGGRQAWRHAPATARFSRIGDAEKALSDLKHYQPQREFRIRRHVRRQEAKI